MTLYEFTYVMTNLLGTYIIYKLMSVFFREPHVGKRIEFIIYTAYYLISTTVFFLARIPFVMMGVNIILFFLLSFIYQATMKKRIGVSFLAYMILMAVEVLVGVVTGSHAISFFENSEYASVVGMLMIRVVSLFVVSVISNLTNIRKDIPIPNFYWISIIFISAASLYLFTAFFDSRPPDQIKATTVMGIILAINFIVLFLYDNLYNAFAVQSEKLLLEQQKDAYEKQLEIIMQSEAAAQITRHDVKNHMITLKNLFENHSMSELNEHISKIISKADIDGQYADSGNYVVDSMINFKMQIVEEMGIHPDIKIDLPQDMGISSYDITVILGNLLDNAITALKACKGEKNISINIQCKKGNLVVTVANTYTGEINRKNGRLRSLKKDKGSHGWGLMSVDEVVRKKGGYMNVRYDDKVFKVMVFYPFF